MAACMVEIQRYHDIDKRKSRRNHSQEGHDIKKNQLGRRRHRMDHPRPVYTLS